MNEPTKPVKFSVNVDGPLAIGLGAFMGMFGVLGVCISALGANLKGTLISLLIVAFAVFLVVFGIVKTVRWSAMSQRVRDKT